MKVKLEAKLKETTQYCSSSWSLQLFFSTNYFPFQEINILTLHSISLWL